MSGDVCNFVWYFFIYSILGWCAEIAYAALKEKHFKNKGFLNGPFCPVYGIGMILIQIFLGNLRSNPVFLVIGCTTIVIVLQYFTGLVVEKLYQKKWWDFSDSKFNISGYVELRLAAALGICGALIVLLVHPVIRLVLSDVSLWVRKAVAIAALILLAADSMVVSGTVYHIRKHPKNMEKLAGDMRHLSNRMAHHIVTYIEGRMTKAYPVMEKPMIETVTLTEGAMAFARGLCFHKLFWLFMISAFLGDLTETIFCYVSSGVIMSRSSVVYGHFSIVWGVGVVILSMMLHRHKDKEDRYIFLFGSVMGGAYEYACSVFTELVFGTVFWDYSHIPFNLGGRINLLYCFFWGVAAVIWIKIIYPLLSSWIERVPANIGTGMTYVFVVFMVFNITISGLAMGRYSARQSGEVADYKIELFLDEEFPDEKIEKIYPNVIVKKVTVQPSG